jgi:hypothetical protein
VSTRVFATRQSGCMWGLTGAQLGDPLGADAATQPLVSSRTCARLLRTSPVHDLALRNSVAGPRNQFFGYCR